jgi:UDP-GlcNAc:undecaprenyl-phosphate GlcNAc-1-phosphate transferase
VLPYLWSFAAAAGVSFVTTPFIATVARRLGWIDRPSDRKVHPRPTPTAGGLALFLGVTAGLGVSRGVPFLSTLHQTSSDVEAALLGAAVVLVLGTIDDTKGVSALGKLAGQILAAGVLVLLGVQLLFFYFPGQGIVSLDPTVAVPLTILWIVVMMNAVNLIDGLDGLAAGMVAIGAIAFFLYMVRAPGVDGAPTTAALLSAVVAGSAIGFLPWNFWPAKIFMGDSGAMLLGLLLAVAAISGVGRNPSPPAGGDFAVFAIPIALPLLVLAIPLVDVVFAVVRRVRKRSGIMHPDKEHIHHHLMEIGHSHRTAVLLMYLWSGLISACALAVAFINGRLLVGAIILLALLLAVSIPWLVLAPRRRAGRADVVTVGEPTAGKPVDPASADADAPRPAASRVRDTA